MAKRSPSVQPKDFGTYQLAKNSGLFRPGTEFILANASPATAKKYPSQDIRNGRPKLGWSGGGGGASTVVNAAPVVPALAFALSYLLYAPNNPVAWSVGIATVPGTTGVPTYSLANNDGGNFQINAATGVVSKLTAAVLTTANHSITIAVAGVAPVLANLPVVIPVAPSQDFSQPGNSGH